MQIGRLVQLPGEADARADIELTDEPGKLLPGWPVADEYQVHVRIEPRQRAQQHGVILNGYQTCDRTHEEGAVWNAPAATPGASLLRADLVECALVEKVWQPDDSRRCNPFRVGQQLGRDGAVGDDAMGEPIAPTVERGETRSRDLIEPASAGNDAATADSRPGRRKDVGIQVVCVNDADLPATQMLQESPPLYCGAQRVEPADRQVYQLDTESLITRTQGTSLMQVKNRHPEALPIEGFHGAHRIQFGAADIEGIDAVAHANGTWQRRRNGGREATHGSLTPAAAARHT